MISKRLYEVKEKLDDYIREQELKPGDKLPTEAKFAAMLGVSRLTLRECFKVFQKEGILRTVNGAGTYLCDTSCHLSNTVNELIGTGMLIRLSGHREGAEIMHIEQTAPKKEWLDLFHLEENQQIVIIKRVRTADGNPVAMAWNIFPDRYVDYQEIREQGFGESIFSYLEQKKKVHISHAESQICALRPGSIFDNEARTVLGEQVVLMKQVHYDDDGKPIFYSRDYFDTNCITLKLRRERREW